MWGAHTDGIGLGLGICGDPSLGICGDSNLKLISYD
jgi:hypothetical protein